MTSFPRFKCIVGSPNAGFTCPSCFERDAGVYVEKASPSLENDGVLESNQRTEILDESCLIAILDEVLPPTLKMFQRAS